MPFNDLGRARSENNSEISRRAPETGKNVSRDNWDIHNRDQGVCIFQMQLEQQQKELKSLKVDYSHPTVPRVRGGMEGYDTWWRACGQLDEHLTNQANDALREQQERTAERKRDLEGKIDLLMKSDAPGKNACSTFAKDLNHKEAEHCKSYIEGKNKEAYQGVKDNTFTQRKRRLIYYLEEKIKVLSGLG